ncbi:conserved hypothetical protein [Theileria equi strain WA]|uniref:Uncharacterized protein n=1 Tax=Theileria equi strain WA TaxID=1537102 RepID=L1LEL2_THEEQ|nr:conserved hypothetical protein [Theileria equi strain WA]EKX73867.1 conserved hypothetical protein [Theileria equi strain WA]|eukprot:XP_004833319.1 conserved hypothetical protein [Theileria equi strain WA]
MSKNKPEENAGIAKFNKFECLWNPKGASDPKLYDSYAYLDLRLDQFLSSIAQDLTFLPNAIYRPAVYVYINGKMVYRSKILDHANDIFGESIRLKIYSPNTVVTLKLFECEEFDINSSKNPRVRQVLYYESTNRVLVSWVDLHIGLLIPEREYDVICTFRSNPAFYAYNPGGLLYYPSESGIPVIHTQKVCCSCKVCSLLSNRSVGGSIESLNKYFDSTYVNGKVKTEKDANIKFPSKANLQKFNIEGEEPPKDEKVTDKKKKGDLDILEVIDMSENPSGNASSSCTCTELEKVPSAIKSSKYDLCLKCHDYEHCCEHSLENYYVSVNFKLTSSSEPIDAFTEIFSSILTPYLKVEDENEEKVSVVSIFEHFYQHYRSLQTIYKHVCYNPRVRYFELVKFAALLLLISLVVNRLFFPIAFLLVSSVAFSVKTTSSKQFEKDRGDALYLSRGLTLLDDGLERAMRTIMDEEIAKTRENSLSKEQVERNNLNIVNHDLVDKTPIYTKMYKSYQRCENIALKTVAFLFSRSIPSGVRGFLLSTLGILDVVVVAINDFLAICRRFGIHIGVICIFLGLASVRFYRMYIYFSKLFVLATLLCLVGDSLAFISQFKRVAKCSLSYLVLTTYRKEWFLNR